MAQWIQWLPWLDLAMRWTLEGKLCFWSLPKQRALIQSVGLCTLAKPTSHCKSQQVKFEFISCLQVSLSIPCLAVISYRLGDVVSLDIPKYDSAFFSPNARTVQVRQLAFHNAIYVPAFFFFFFLNRKQYLKMQILLKGNSSINHLWRVLI